MEIRFTHKAERQLASLPKNTQQRIAEKMRFYGSQKNPLKFAKRLTNPEEGGFRFRIGKQRITFDVQNDTIYILKIGPRDKAYL